MFLWKYCCGLLVLGIITIHYINGDSCDAPCNWTAWGSWSDCSRSCGGGKSSRTRGICCSRSHGDVYACLNDCGMEPDFHEIQDCNNICLNGGYYIKSDWFQYCLCRDAFYSYCCTHECPQIANCKSRKCTASNNTECLQCEEQGILFEKDDSDRKCTRLCSHDNRWCWPGTCTQTPAYDRSCSCAAGFSKNYGSAEASCQPTQRPNITTCIMRAIDVNGDVKQSPTIGKTTHCDNQQDFYGNFQVDRFKTDFLADYLIDINITNVPRPAWIQSEQFGIVEASIQIIKKPVAGGESTILTRILMRHNSYKPKNVFEKENVTITNTATLADGDRLCLRFTTSGGGHLISNNRIPSSHISSTVAYTKVTHSRTLCYYYDFTTPSHCSEHSSTCTTQPLSLSSRITKNRNINVTFRGWADIPPTGRSSKYASGIESYEITIHAVQDKSGEQVMESKTWDNTKPILTSSSSPVTLTLPDQNPALFGILLTVKDVANNVKHARRFVLYDSISRIEIASQNTLHCSSATVATNYTWQTHNSEVCVSWVKRYHNDKYAHKNVLRPINGGSNIFSIYEQMTGLLPVNGTINVDGIIRFTYSLFQMLTQTSVPSPVSVNATVPNTMDQKVCINHSPADGETLNFDLYVEDVVGNQYKESLVTFVDSTAPLIENIWLVRDGHHQLYVHNTTYMSSMELQFETFDLHSGLHSILWEFREKDGGTLLGSGSIGVQRLKISDVTCQLSKCYCPNIGRCENFGYLLSLNPLVSNKTQIGDHNRNYFFRITTTNIALLMTIIEVDVLVDNSPPEVGVVFDGRQYAPDVDYISANSIAIYWHGFVDHESGIRFYTAAIGPKCLTKEQMLSVHTCITNDAFTVLNTSTSSASFALEQDGLYIISIIGYNNAIEPSNVACSDGIMRDSTPPIINNITIRGSKTLPNIVCSNGTPWYVSKDVTKHSVSYRCGDICSNMDNIPIVDLIPVVDSNSSISRCIAGNMSNVYLPTDTLDIRWNSLDHQSTVGYTLIGLGSTVTSKTSPDLMTYQKTSHGNRHRLRHMGLSNGDHIYIFIKASNKASLQTIASYGPVVVDESKPVCQKPVVHKVIISHVMITWSLDTFTDPDQPEGLASMRYHLYYSNGKGETISTPSTVTPIHNDNACDGHYGCITLNMQEVKQLELDGRYPVYVVFVASNVVGRTCSVTCDPIYVPSKFPPSIGNVLELTNNTYDDVDYVIRGHELCIDVQGFRHHNSDVQIEIGIGDCLSCNDTVRSFTNSTSFESFCFNTNSLSEGRLYTTIVRASNSGGMTEVKSDGFRVIDSDLTLQSFGVYDGLGCKYIHSIEIFEIPNIANSTRVSSVLKIGHVYTLHVHVQLADAVNITFTNGEMYILNEISAASNGTIIEVVPTIHFPTISITRSQPSNIFISITECQLDMGFVINKGTISAHWELLHNTQFVTHFVVFLLDGNTANVIEVKNIHSELQASIDIDVLADGFYKVAVKPCFGAVCLDPVLSSGVHVTSKSNILRYTNLSAEIVQGINCTYELHASWSHYISPDNDKVSLYRWAVFKDDTATNLDTCWVHVHPDLQTDVHQCTDNSYRYLKRFFCLEVVMMSGHVDVLCDPITTTIDPNTYTKNVVYDVDINDQRLDQLLPSLHSKNIGKQLLILHQMEIDFLGSDRKGGAIMIGVGDSLVTWTVRTALPETNNTCYDDVNCLYSTSTTGGYLQLPNVDLPESTIIICAETNERVAVREKNYELIHGVSGCSNGFIVDRSPPSVGHVTLSSHNGYITNLLQQSIYWYGFTDNSQVFNGGGELTYRYAIGSTINSVDIKRFTSTKNTQHIRVDLDNVKNGQQIYVTVQATDGVGLTATAFSDNVIYDSSPPTVDWLRVGSIHRHLIYVLNTDINVYWGSPRDNESGVRMTQIGIGSNAHGPDLLGYQVVHQSSFYLHDTYYLTNGHAYYFFLRVTNNAGLNAVRVSDRFVVDFSPPDEGIVLDGNMNMTDLDYQSKGNVISASWTGFYDDQSGIVHYLVGIGLSPASDDIHPFMFVGLRTECSWNINTRSGTTYFVTVSACNKINLCTTASSDGVTIDTSPPIRGRVHVGLAGKHQHFIGSQNHVEIGWFNIHDPNSGLEHVEFCIGNAKSKCDVIPFENINLIRTVIKSGLSLPANKSMYVTIRAFNMARLFSDTYSDQFLVDVTAPHVIQVPSIVNNGVSKHNQTQIDNSLIHVIWKFEDNESPLMTHSLSLISLTDGRVSRDTISVINIREYVYQLSHEERISNGESYIIRVVACNAAGHCTSADSGTFIVDSTPPSIGQFEGGLRWNIDAAGDWHLSLSWAGFIDAESAIEEYHIHVGNTYSGSEYLLNYYIVTHTGDMYSQQFHNVSLSRSLQIGQEVILSIYAVNTAGLISDISRLTAYVISDTLAIMSGLLEQLTHSCRVHYCENDCTCSVVGGKCDVIAGSMCISVINLTDHETLRIAVGFKSQNAVSASSACIISAWDTINNFNSTNTIERSEWSAGIKDMPIGDGIFDIRNENIWHDVGMRNHMTYCLQGTDQLLHKHNYVAYVKAWYSDTRYSIFTSSPFLVDLNPPSIKTGKQVQLKDGSCVVRVRYVTSLTNITACWHGVFIDSQSGISSYLVSIGTQHGFSDVTELNNVGNETRFTWIDIKLHPGSTYYISVIAINSVNLYSEISSVTFIVDNDPPRGGVVYINAPHTDISFVNSNSSLFISWYGFQDDESGIKRYHVTVTEEGKNQTGFRSVGRRTSVIFTDLSLKHARRYSAVVRAEDAVGRFSDPVMSTSFLVDTTPPVGYSCNSFKIKDEFVVEYVNNQLNVSRFTSLEDGLYILSIYALLTAPEMDLMVYVNEHARYLSIKASQNNTVNYNYSFYNTYVGGTVLSIAGSDFVRMETSVYFKLQYCSDMNMNEVVGHRIEIYQTHSHQLDVKLHVTDPESGIRTIKLGAGTTRSGYQIQSFKSVLPDNHQSIWFDLPHMAPVYVTAIVENNAGSISYFTSDVIHVDHTPPIIVTSEIKVEHIQYADTVNVAIQWTSSDQNVANLHCSISVGTSEGLDDIISRYRVSFKGNVTHSILELPHGSLVCGEVECINHVGLISNANIPCQHIITQPPNTSYCAIVMVHANKWGVTEPESLYDVTDDLIFAIDGMDYQSDLYTYTYDVTSNNTKILSRREMICNYAHIHGLSEGDYKINVQATNILKYASNVIRQNVSRYGSTPTLTGTTCNITSEGGYSYIYNVNCSSVYDVPGTAQTYLYLTIGTQTGYPDLAHFRQSDHTEISSLKELSELFISLIIVHGNGNYISYNEHFVAN